MSITQKEYAEIRGLHRSSISRAIRDGRLRDSLTADNQIISVAAANAEWSSTTRKRRDAPSPEPSAFARIKSGSTIAFLEMTTPAQNLEELLDTHALIPELIQMLLDRGLSEIDLRQHFVDLAGTTQPDTTELLDTHIDGARENREYEAELAEGRQAGK